MHVYTATYLKSGDHFGLIICMKSDHCKKRPVCDCLTGPTVFAAIRLKMWRFPRPIGKQHLVKLLSHCRTLIYVELIKWLATWARRKTLLLSADCRRFNEQTEKTPAIGGGWQKRKRFASLCVDERRICSAVEARPGMGLIYEWRAESSTWCLASENLIADESSSV